MSHTLSYFKALADETRLRLLHVLYHHELSVNELVSILSMGQSRVSRHLKILSEAGLLQWRRDGLWVFYAAATSGQGQRFLHSIMPHIDGDGFMQYDLAAALRCIEERNRKTRQFFNDIAEDWDDLHREILGHFDLAKAVCEAMPKPCHLAVDLGCGTGAVLEKILPQAQGVVGVDGSASMLEMARRRFVPEFINGKNSRVSLRIGELDYLPLRDGEADFACINFVLHHLSTPLDVLVEVERVLCKKGRILITDFDKHDNENMRNKYGDRWLGFTPEMLTNLVRDAGLTLLNIERRNVEKKLGLLLVLAEK